MVSTVTTTTVWTVTTVVLAGSLGLVAVVALSILLVQREPIAINEAPRAGVLVRALNIAIATLLMTYVTSVVVKALQRLE